MLILSFDCHLETEDSVRLVPVRIDINANRCDGETGAGIIERDQWAIRVRASCLVYNQLARGSRSNCAKHAIRGFDHTIRRAGDGERYRGANHTTRVRYVGKINVRVCVRVASYKAAVNRVGIQLDRRRLGRTGSLVTLIQIICHLHSLPGKTK